MLAKEGDSAMHFLGEYDPVVPSYILSRIGRTGNLLIVSQNPYIERNIFTAFFNLSVDFDGIKGVEEKRKPKGERKLESTDKRLTGANHLDNKLMAEMRRFLLRPLSDEEYYQAGLGSQDNDKISQFLDNYNIQAISYSMPRLPDTVAPKSVNLVVERDRFADVPEEEKETVLYELDRILAPGGYLIFRENARQQTLIKYYGEDLFSKGYQRSKTRGINSAQLLVYQKLGSGVIPFGGPLRGAPETHVATEEEKNLCQDLHTWFIKRQPGQADEYREQFYRYAIHLLRNSHQINEDFVSKQEVDETLKDSLSVSWFRRTGLFEPLLTEFSGDVKQAADFILERYQQEQEKAAQQEQKFFDGTLAVDDTKSSYSLEDLAKELNISVGYARRLVGRSGLVRTDRNRGRGSFTSRQVQARQFNFSPQEFPIMRDSIKQRLQIERARNKKVVEEAVNELKQDEIVEITPEAPALPKPPDNSRPFYTVQDVAKELGVKPSAIRDALKQVRVKKAKTHWRLTPGNVSSQKTVPEHFTYAEYLVVKDLVQKQKGGQNG